MRQMKPLLKTNPPNPYTWSYTFDTYFENGDNNWWISSTSYDYNQAVIPFTLYDTDATVTVNWGDGNIETLTSSNYPNLNDVRASIHTYSGRGTYTISITSSDWHKIYFLGSCPGHGGWHVGGYGDWYGTYYERFADEKYIGEIGYTANGYNWEINQYELTGLLAGMRFGCIKILNPLPRIAGTMCGDRYYDDSYSLDEAPEGLLDGIPKYGMKLPNSMYFLFSYYLLLSEIPENIFINNPNVHNFEGVFWGCHKDKDSYYSSSIVPVKLNLLPNLFSYSPRIENVSHCFELAEKDLGSSSNIRQPEYLSNFSFHFKSKIISNVDAFCDNDKTGTVYVPRNSLTSETFHSYAANHSNITVVDE